MPSPFPGMDPYLEGSLWPSVHFQLCSEIVRQLAPKLRTRYLALTPGHLSQDVPHVSIEIQEASTRRLVTSIEVLSIGSKNGEGRAKYLAKRKRLLMSRAHLLELDLLREGERVPMQGPWPMAQYFALVSRAEARPLVNVWPIALPRPMPTVPVPLLPGDSDAILDLQEALTNVYDTVGYDLAVDYSRTPEVPLPLELASWAAQVLARRRVKKTILAPG